MADLVDIANDEQDELLQRCIANRASFKIISEKKCRSCDSDIPEKRREIGGVSYCVDCQTALEKDLKHYKQRG